MGPSIMARIGEHNSRTVIDRVAIILKLPTILRCDIAEYSSPSSKSRYECNIYYLMNN